MKEDIWTKCRQLEFEARTLDYKFKSSNYEWEIGKEVFAQFYENILCTGSPAEVKTLMGIPVRYNHKDPGCLKLWREIHI